MVRRIIPGYSYQHLKGDEQKDIDVYETILESIIRGEANHAAILQRVYERLSFPSQSADHSER